MKIFPAREHDVGVNETHRVNIGDKNWIRCRCSSEIMNYNWNRTVMKSSFVDVAEGGVSNEE